MMAHALSAELRKRTTEDPKAQDTPVQAVLAPTVHQKLPPAMVALAQAPTEVTTQAHLWVSSTLQVRQFWEPSLETMRSEEIMRSEHHKHKNLPRLSSKVAARSATTVQLLERPESP